MADGSAIELNKLNPGDLYFSLNEVKRFISETKGERNKHYEYDHTDRQLKIQKIEKQKGLCPRCHDRLISVKARRKARKRADYFNSRPLTLVSHGVSAYNSVNTGNESEAVHEALFRIKEISKNPQWEICGADKHFFIGPIGILGSGYTTQYYPNDVMSRLDEISRKREATCLSHSSDHDEHFFKCSKIRALWVKEWFWQDLSESSKQKIKEIADELSARILFPTKRNPYNIVKGIPEPGVENFVDRIDGIEDSTFRNVYPVIYKRIDAEDTSDLLFTNRICDFAHESEQYRKGLKTIWPFQYDLPLDNDLVVYEEDEEEA